MRRGFASTVCTTYAALLTVAALLGGCSVDLLASAETETLRNECTPRSECGGGSCLRGSCVAAKGALDALLLEVTPPTSTLFSGGVRFLQVVDGFSQNASGYELNLRRLALLRGFMVPQTWLGVCESFKVTLSPREQNLGLSEVTYTAEARLRDFTLELEQDPNRWEQVLSDCEGVIRPNPQLYVFELHVPADDYDVYIEPSPNEPETSGCTAVPYLFPEQPVAVGAVCLPLALAAPQKLNVAVGWTPDATGAQTLDGWTAEIIHPVTGQRLSDRRPLVTITDPPCSAAYCADLLFSSVSGSNVTCSGTGQLLRLTPPDGVIAPVIQHCVLEAYGPGQEGIPELAPFPAPVELDGWIWEKEPFDEGTDISVAATVSFTATRLDGVSSGIAASYSTTVEVEEEADGRLFATVLPGDYLVRVEPRLGSGLAATETVINVSCARRTDGSCEVGTEPVLQAGRTLEVPRAASLTGRAFLLDGRTSLSDGVVHALPAQYRTRRCAMDLADGGAASDGGLCDNSPIGVLEEALGQHAFVPRAASATVCAGATGGSSSNGCSQRGGFLIGEMDCGACEPGNGAFFDFFVRPSDGSGYSWFVRPQVLVDGTEELGEVKLPLPILRRGVVQLVQEGQAPIKLAGALIRAYIFRDNSGEPIDDPTNLPNCAEMTVGPGDTCIRSILQVAETRAREDGGFELALPSQLD